MTYKSSAGQGGGIVKTLTSRAYIPALVLLSLACLPMAAHADSITLDGAPVESLSFATTVSNVSGLTVKTFTVVMDGTDALPYKTDLMLGTKFDTLTLDEISTIDGTTTEDVLEFTDDTVDKFQFTDPDELTADVTFDYDKVTIMESIVGSGDGNGGGNTVPEPSSTALLASGLLGMVGFSRKKLFN
jgi:hypothetical protein